jgi:16S rRNA (guanine527-N7)-methyltransferase
MAPTSPTTARADQAVLLSNTRALHIDLTDAQVAAFSSYQSELLDWNARVNLTGVTDHSDVQVKLFADSLSLLSVLPPGALRLLDVGSGAGFPGLPVKLVRPEIELTLLDSVGKKTAFLAHLVGSLELDGVRVLTGRAEELGQRPRERESFDVVTAKAVASLSVLAELCLPLTRVGGILIAQKNGRVDEEIRESGRAISILGGRLRPVSRYHLPDLPDERWLVIVEKTRPSPTAYPRRPGVPAKDPL